MCSKAKILDATAYLLERTGDTMGAFKLILDVSLYIQIDYVSMWFLADKHGL